MRALSELPSYCRSHIVALLEPQVSIHDRRQKARESCCCQAHLLFTLELVRRKIC